MKEGTWGPEAVLYKCFLVFYNDHGLFLIIEAELRNVSYRSTGTSFFHWATRSLAKLPTCSCFRKLFTVFPTPVSYKIDKGIVRGL